MVKTYKHAPIELKFIMNNPCDILNTQQVSMTQESHWRGQKGQILGLHSNSNSKLMIFVTPKHEKNIFNDIRDAEFKRGQKSNIIIMPLLSSNTLETVLLTL